MMKRFVSALVCAFVGTTVQAQENWDDFTSTQNNGTIHIGDQLDGRLLVNIGSGSTAAQLQNQIITSVCDEAFLFSAPQQNFFDVKPTFSYDTILLELIPGTNIDDLRPVLGSAVDAAIMTGSGITDSYRINFAGTLSETQLGQLESILTNNPVRSINSIVTPASIPLSAFVRFDTVANIEARVSALEAGSSTQTLNEISQLRTDMEAMQTSVVALVENSRRHSDRLENRSTALSAALQAPAPAPGANFRAGVELGFAGDEQAVGVNFSTQRRKFDFSASGAFADGASAARAGVGISWWRTRNAAHVKTVIGNFSHS